MTLTEQGESRKESAKRERGKETWAPGEKGISQRSLRR